ncbi:pilus assembly protein TadG-related protein [Streptomyces sp. NPDC087917]|uniref:pilus assembly protein TadG-related protein n=1 Tax=Streptomyces sp. NPDC087917 TaxID=3155060 RepID=UPI00341FD49F
MTAARAGDRGQAFPIYIVMVAGLLFAALAFFVVGMAGVKRSDAQGAADSAALAAARESRDRLFAGLDLLTLKPADWEAILRGDRLDGRDGCGRAVEFAALNGASAACSASGAEFTVNATTNSGLGKSVVPGTEGTRGTAAATAVIEPHCTLGSAATPAPTPEPTSSPGPVAEPALVELRCSGEVISVDPLKPGSLVRLARMLFTVRLID